MHYKLICKYIGLAAMGGYLVLGSSFARAELGVTPTRILLGQSAALSGPAQDLGRELRDGAKLYFDHVNAQGGINGRKIELLSLDDGYEPERAAANTKQLINKDNVFALFGYVGTPTSNAAVPLFTAASVPFIAPFTGAQSLREPLNRNIFNIRASYFDETEKIVEHLVGLGMTTIAVLYQNDAYGAAGLSGVERALAKRQLKLIASAPVERNKEEVGEAVKTIAAARPDAVIMISVYKTAAAFVKSLKAANREPQFFTVSFVGSVPLARSLGSDGAGVSISQVVPSPWASSFGIVREYQHLMGLSGHSDYSFTSLEGFIAAKVLSDGIKHAGQDLTRPKLVAALENMHQADMGGFLVSFSSQNHNASTYIDLTVISKSGKFLR